MELAENNFQLLITELEEAEKLCNESEPVEDKLYFFSASFGIINRIMNFEYNPILIFMHQVLKEAHQAIANRLAAARNQGSLSNVLPDEFIEKLFLYYSELIHAIKIKNSQEIHKVLEKFSTLSYATTGNGFYLYLKRRLVLL